MMTVQQHIEYMASAIGAYTHETSDQVEARLLGRGTMSEREAESLLLHALAEMRPKLPSMVGKELPS